MTKFLSNSVEPVVYLCLFMIIGLYIFVANDASLPLSKILDWQYGLPCMIYSSFVTLFIFGVSEILKTFTRKKNNYFKCIRLCWHPTWPALLVCPNKLDFSIISGA